MGLITAFSIITLANRPLSAGLLEIPMQWQCRTIDWTRLLLCAYKQFNVIRSLFAVHNWIEYVFNGLVNYYGCYFHCIFLLCLLVVIETLAYGLAMSLMNATVADILHLCISLAHNIWCLYALLVNTVGSDPIMNEISIGWEMVICLNYILGNDN